MRGEDINEEYVRQQYEDMKRNKEQQIKNMKRNGRIIALFFLFAAVVYVFFNGIQMTTCTEKVNAVVIEVNCELEIVRTGRHRMGSRRRYKYCPVFEYTYDGKMYTSGGGVSSISDTRFHVGDKEEIYIDPDDPQSLYMAGEKNVFVKGIVFLIMLGAVFYFLLAVLPGKMHKKNDAKNTIDLYH